MMELDLKDKIVVVTGANGGIGSSIVQAFLEQDALVCCCVRGGASRLEHLWTWMEERNIERSRVFVIDMDLGDLQSVENGIRTIIQEFGGIHVLINNAGWAVEAPFLMTDEDEWLQTVDVNLNATARISRLVARQMLRQKSGSIINISSVVGTTVGRGVTAYAVAKAGINRLTQLMAVELGRKGIRINAVAPGAIETKMTAPLMARAGDWVLENTPLARIGNPDEVANAILFLASEKTAAFITGQILNVDGGISL